MRSQTIKCNLGVDWTAPHRDDVKAGVCSAVRRVLKRKAVRAEDLEPFIAAVMRQAEQSYREWPLAARTLRAWNALDGGSGPLSLKPGATLLRGCPGR
jgi:hypothetical protein